MELSESEKQVIWHALSVAADRFDDDAKQCAEYPRIAEQFEKQAAETRELINRFE